MSEYIKDFGDIYIPINGGLCLDIERLTSKCIDSTHLPCKPINNTECIYLYMDERCYPWLEDHRIYYNRP